MGDRQKREKSEREKAIALSEAFVNNNTKKCPKCKVSILKNEGCNHMECRQCNHHFCWTCGGKMGKDNRLIGVRRGKCTASGCKHFPDHQVYHPGEGENDVEDDPMLAAQASRLYAQSVRRNGGL